MELVILVDYLVGKDNDYLALAIFRIHHFGSVRDLSPIIWLRCIRECKKSCPFLDSICLVE